MKFFLLSLSLVFLASCSLKQKKVCNQNNAYQAGYRAALKGNLEADAASEAGVCQDFEAYSPTMYRQDVKAGYAKGKAEYCTKPNYEKWGQEDGNKGVTSHPSNYTVEMRICLQDNQFAKLAKKTYKKYFQETFCSSERMTSQGQSQANNFSNLDSSGIRKRCGKKSGSLIASLRKAYKKQMKANCTPTYWMLKGEQTAQSKTSKTVHLAKIQKCPESKQATLLNTYSSSYNDKKKIMLQEEQMALERRRQDEQIRLERERHESIVALEKERIELERQRINGGYSHHHPGSPHPTGSYNFYHDGKPLSASCHIDSRRREARVIVHNPNQSHISLSGNWLIKFYDPRHRLIKTEKEHEFLSLSRGEREEFTESFIPSESATCTARYIR